MLHNFTIPEFQQRIVISGTAWMQDEPPPHVSQCVRPVLQQHLGDRVISRHLAVSWSPDPLTFFRWSSHAKVI